MSELDLLKLLQSCGEESDLADFTPEEIGYLIDLAADLKEKKKAVLFLV